MSSSGWDAVWNEFRQEYNSYSPQESDKRKLFIDEFYCCCLQMIELPNENNILWKIIEDWSSYRNLPARCGNLSAEQQKKNLTLSRVLRSKIHEYIGKTPSAQRRVLEERQETAIIKIWWQVFLNCFSVINLQDDRHESEPKYNLEFPDTESNKYARLLLASLYEPFHAEKFDIDMIALWNEPNLANCYKVILSLWLTNIPYYTIEEQQCQRLLRTGADLGQISVPAGFFDVMVKHISHSFWIASYAGGNNVKPLSALGDFIVEHTSRFLPQYSSYKLQQRERGAKLRIGYISRCFYNQSVSYYMVNRVIHHDRSKFEVYVFALGEHHDEMTQLFFQNASHFQGFRKLSNIGKIAEQIIDAQLDMLIYTEIGMDPATYTLAGMQLAPIQCAMVGHGTTTGLPTIQYYLSGDFEAPEADAHYREKLIRLPNLGAAQYLPPLGSSMTSTREEWKIPEEVVLFVSCANGIKHIPGRDKILIEILNACIALKPYSSYDTGNGLDLRIMAAAREAGVENRLFIVPPLKYVGPLLAIADIQLDTFPYGGWTTNMEALYRGLPIITQEGNMARSRWGAHLLRALGISEGIAKSEEEYVEWAVRFAQDKELRRNVKARISSQVGHVLFNGAAAQVAYEEALLKIFAENMQQ